MLPRVTQGPCDVKDDYIAQSPRFIPTLLISQIIGVVLFTVVAVLLVTWQTAEYSPGTVIGSISREPQALATVVFYCVTLCVRPHAAAHFLIKMTSKPNTQVLGLIVGLPAFLVTLLGGLILAAVQRTPDSVDLAQQFALWGGLALCGLAVHLVTLIWWSIPVRNQRLSPPPRHPGMFVGVFQRGRDNDAKGQH